MAFILEMGEYEKNLVAQQTEDGNKQIIQTLKKGPGRRTTISAIRHDASDVSTPLLKGG